MSYRPPTAKSVPHMHCNIIHSHVCISHGGHHIQQREGVDNEPELLVRQEGVEEEEAQ